MKKNIGQKKKSAKELEILSGQLENAKTKQEEKMAEEHIKSLKENMKKANNEFLDNLNQINIAKPLPVENASAYSEKTYAEREKERKKTKEEKMAALLEERTLKRLGKTLEKKRAAKKIKKPSKYIKAANFLFANASKKLAKKEAFEILERDLVKANLQYVPAAYLSLTFFTTLISLFVAMFVLIFFLFFNFSAGMPMITKAAEPLATRFVKIFWILLAIPLGTFLFSYFYPSLEKRAAEYRIDSELPFATINMAAISGSMIDPTKIFSIMMETQDYPALEKQFTKLMNEINIYGYDLVTALKSVAYNSPSKKLSELFNGLATTIISGGNLPEFFGKRSESLLFEYKIEREKNTKSAETFMDIYISIVIAAPMILMLLMMMIKIGGLGISLSTGAITLITILAVTIINVVFMTFLHLKQT